MFNIIVIFLADSKSVESCLPTGSALETKEDNRKRNLSPFYQDWSQFRFGLSFGGGFIYDYSFVLFWQPWLCFHLCSSPFICLKSICYTHYPAISLDLASLDHKLTCDNDARLMSCNLFKDMTRYSVLFYDMDC